MYLTNPIRWRLIDSNAFLQAEKFRSISSLEMLYRQSAPIVHRVDWTEFFISRANALRTLAGQPTDDCVKDWACLQPIKEPLREFYLD